MTTLERTPVQPSADGAIERSAFEHNRGPGPRGKAAVRVVATIAEWSQVLEGARRVGRTVGLVPTMGALHGGHRSLIERAAAECDLVTVTVFVNPLQFGDPDDIANYPRTLDADIETAAVSGAHVVFVPPVSEMYPQYPESVPTTVSVAGLSGHWEGASRPGHFDGVATVVAKLFAAAGRCRAYFGEKDFQQLAVVRRMALDLSLPVDIVGCSTVRDPDGLAQSSRNVRLSEEQRTAALVLFRALRTAVDAIARGENRPTTVEALMTRAIAAEPMVDLDYAVLVDADSLDRATSISPAGRLRLLIAAQVGPVRLIDNMDPMADPMTPPGAGFDSPVVSTPPVFVPYSPAMKGTD